MPTGTVKLTWSSTTKRITAAFDVYGLTPASSHAVHLHTGTCLRQGGVVIPFPDLTANAVGAATATLTSLVAAPSGIPPGTYLNVHLAPSAQLGSPGSLTFTPLACADVPSGTKASATLTMQALPQAAQHPTGSANLSYDQAAKKLTVTLDLAGLAPGSGHAAHIHLGSCQAQGAIKYPLTALTADSSGSARSTTIIPDVASSPPSTGWYVNVHLGAPAQLTLGGKPTLYFQPILCGNVT